MAVLLHFASDFATEADVPLGLDTDGARIPRSPSELARLEQLHSGARASPPPGRPALLLLTANVQRWTLISGSGGASPTSSARWRWRLRGRLSWTS